MSLKIRLTLDNKGFTQALRESSAQAESAKKRLNEVSKGLAVRAAATAAAFAGIGAGVKKAVDAYAVQEQAEKRLGQALLASGSAANISLDELKKYASELQNVTTFGDEATLSAQALMINLGGNLTKEVIKSGTVAMQNMAAAMGTDMKGAAQQLGVALASPTQGMTRLRRAGIILTEAEQERIKVLEESGEKSKAQAILLEKVNEKFEGQARLTAEGTGKMTQFSNSVGDLWEEIGKNLLPVVADLSDKMRLVVEEFKENPENVKRLTTYIVAFGVALGATAATLTAAAIATKTMAIGLGAYSAATTLATKITGLFSGGMKKSIFSMNAAKIAVKGLIGSTGIGLLIVFLPEIIELAKFVWNNFGEIVDVATKRIGQILKNFAKLFISATTFNLAGVKESWAEMKNGTKGLFTDLSKISSDYEMKKRVEQEKAAEEEEARMAARMQKSLDQLKAKNAEEDKINQEKKEKTAVEKEIEEMEELERKRAIYERLGELDIENEEMKNTIDQERHEIRKEWEGKKDADLLALARKGAKSKSGEDKKRGELALKELERRKSKEEELEQAKWDAYMGLARVSGQALNEILGRDSKEAFYINKALALADVYMNTAAAVAKSIAISPLTAGQPMAGIAKVTGGIQAGIILAQQPPKKAQMGGIVPRQFGTPLKGDHQPMMLEAGEMITPGRDVGDNRMANQLIIDRLGGGDFFDDEKKQEVEIGIQSEASSFIFAESIANRQLGIGVT